MTVAPLLALLARGDIDAGGPAAAAASTNADPSTTTGSGASSAAGAPGTSAQASAATGADAGAAALVHMTPHPTNSLNLLVGLPPPIADKVKNPERMTDGQAPEPGETWNSQYTSIIEKDGSVIWDFGTPTEFDGIWIQADNNDIYTVASSDDGHAFTTVWDSLTVDAPGMQARTWATAHARGRYVKLTARGGDGSYSIGEFALFTDGAQAKRYVPAYVRPIKEAPPPFDGNWVVVLIVTFGVIYFVRQMKPKPSRTDPTDSPPKA